MTRSIQILMKFLSANVALVVATLGVGALSFPSEPVRAQDSGTILTVDCVDRPKDVRPPPRRLAPKLRAMQDKLGAAGTIAPARSGLGMKSVCPSGKVPAPKILAFERKKIDKGNPLLGPDPERQMLQLEEAAHGEFIRRHARSFEEVYKQRKPGAERDRTPPPPGPPGGPPACDGVPNFESCYYYASAAFSTAADGGGMTQSIKKPVYVNTGGFGHTLDELAVQGGDNNGDIIEIGWLVSTEQYGNANPHLFVFHWKNWAPTCYDACGWVQWSNTYHPAMDLGSAVGKKVYIGYVLWQGNWWAWFDNQWMGYFPGSEWDGKYTKTSLIQWFGEVASQNGVPPKTQMGNGQFSSAPKAASMSTLCDVDAKAWICWYRDKQLLTDTVPAYYDIGRVSFGAVRYGGPGQ